MFDFSIISNSVFQVIAPFIPGVAIVIIFSFFGMLFYKNVNTMKEVFHSEYEGEFWDPDNKLVDHRDEDRRAKERRSIKRRLDERRLS